MKHPESKETHFKLIASRSESMRKKGTFQLKLCDYSHSAFVSWQSFVQLRALLHTCQPKGTCCKGHSGSSTWLFVSTPAAIKESQFAVVFNHASYCLLQLLKSCRRHIEKPSLLYRMPIRTTNKALWITGYWSMSHTWLSCQQEKPIINKHPHLRDIRCAY